MTQRDGVSDREVRSFMKLFDSRAHGCLGGRSSQESQRESQGRDHSSGIGYEGRDMVVQRTEKQIKDRVEGEKRWRKTERKNEREEKRSGGCEGEGGKEGRMRVQTEWTWGKR